MCDSNSAESKERQNIESLIADLRSEDGMTRQRARHALVAIKEPAIHPLITAFEDRGEQMHWEVAKTLSEIGSAKTIQCFLKGMEDEDFSIRWISAEGLITIGQDAVSALLNELEHHSDSLFLVEGIHHVLYDLVNRKFVDETTRQAIAPVLEAYNRIEAQLYIPMAAMEGLNKLK